MELIAREALESKLQKSIEELADKTGFFEGIKMGYESAVHFVEQAPIVEEHKQGYWIQVDDTKCKCSACEITHLIAQYPSGDKNYCPNCGAEMKKE